MNRFRILSLLFLVVALALNAQEDKASTPLAPQIKPQIGPLRKLAPPPPEVTNRCILLVNAAGIPSDQFETIRAYAEKDLCVKVEGTTLDIEWASLPAKAPFLLQGNRKAVVILGKASENTRILSAPDNQWAIVNMSQFTNNSEPNSLALRQRQGAMRGIGCAFGVALCQDIHCVMRMTRKSGAEPDGMGGNYCLITRRAFQANASSKGLFPFPKKQGAKEAVKDSPAP